MNPESRGSHPAYRLASETLGLIVSLARNLSASERERVGAAIEPQLAILEERRRFLEDKRTGLLKEAEPLHGARTSGGFLVNFANLAVAVLLAAAGYAFALMTLQPFNLGQAAKWFSLGQATVVPFTVDRLLEHFRSSRHFRSFVVVAAAATALASLVPFAEVRGEILAHHLSAGDAVVIETTVQGAPSAESGADRVVVLLRRSMIFAALAFELAAGLALFYFREGRRNNDLGRLNQINKEVLRSENDLLKVIKEIHELLARPSRENGEFWREFNRGVMERIGDPRNGGPLGVVALAAAMTASVLQAAGGTQIVMAWDLSQTSAVDYTGRSELEQNRDAIAVVLSRLPPGSSVTVIGITDQTYVNTNVLLSAELTADPGFFNSRLTAGRRRLVGEWQKRSAGLTASFRETDILGALRFAGEVLAGGRAERKVLAIFSDGRNCTAELNLETPLVIAVGPAMRRLRKLGALSSLTGVEVFLFGAGDHSGKRSTNYTVGLKDFWGTYIKEAGGRLVVFSTTRDRHSLQLVTTVTTAGGTSP